MTRLNDLPFYDRDPSPKEQATPASRARVKEGFDMLIEELEWASERERNANQRKDQPPVPDHLCHPDDWVKLPRWPWAISKALLGMLEKKTPSP